MEHSANFRSLITEGKIKLIPLTQDYDLSTKSFDCDNDDLNNFLFDDSKIYLKYLLPF